MPVRKKGRERGRQYSSRSPGTLSGSSFRGLDEGADIPVGERAARLAVAWRGRHVVVHQHPVVADLPVSPDRLPHVHVSLVGVDFAEVVTAATDVAEVDVDDLAAGAEPADDVKNLLARFLQHL